MYNSIFECTIKLNYRRISVSCEAFPKSQYVSISNFGFLMLILKLGTTILWKSQNLVSIALAFKNLSCLLVSSTSTSIFRICVIIQLTYNTFWIMYDVMLNAYKKVCSSHTHFKSVLISVLSCFEFDSPKPTLLLDTCCFKLLLHGF